MESRIGSANLQDLNEGAGGCVVNLAFKRSVGESAFREIGFVIRER
jgi:hypothetical protein